MSLAAFPKKDFSDRFGFSPPVDVLETIDEFSGARVERSLSIKEKILQLFQGNGKQTENLKRALKNHNITRINLAFKKGASRSIFDYKDTLKECISEENSEDAILYFLNQLDRPSLKSFRYQWPNYLAEGTKWTLYCLAVCVVIVSTCIYVGCITVVIKASAVSLGLILSLYLPAALGISLSIKTTAFLYGIGYASAACPLLYYALHAVHHFIEGQDPYLQFAFNFIDQIDHRIRALGEKFFCHCTSCRLVFKKMKDPIYTSLLRESIHEWQKGNEDPANKIANIINLAVAQDMLSHRVHTVPHLYLDILFFYRRNLKNLPELNLPERQNDL